MEAEYLFLGHSNEKYQPYEERKPLPQGYRLLLLAECDIQTKRADVEMAIELAAAQPLNVSKFRVFQEGDPYPSLTLQLLGDYDIKTAPGATKYTGISRSGAYALPIELGNFLEMDSFIERYWNYDKEKQVASYHYPGENIKIKTTEKIFEGLKKNLLVKEDEIDSSIVEFQFEGAFFPKRVELKEIAKTSKTIDDLRKKLTFDLEDLFEKLGPGTYIVPLCRSVSANAGDEEQDLLDYIYDEIDPELPEKLTLRHGTNRLAYRKQKLNYLNTIKNHPKLQEEPWKEKIELVRRKLGRIVKTIQNTRSKSALKHRGARKTRRITAS